MKTFLIKELENITGIRSQTIRMWERRFKLLHPQRTKTNIRNYSLQDLKYLMYISLQLKTGKSISAISTTSLEHLEQEVLSFSEDHIIKPRIIADLIYAMYSLDTDGFENILNNCVHQLGIHHTIEEVIIPFLHQSCITSYKDTSCEVHFAVTAVRRKIVTGIESCNNTLKISPLVLLFLPSKEHYDLMLLYMNYVLRKKGMKVLYLGTNISVENLNRVLLVKSPGILCTYISQHNKEQYNPIFKYILSYDPMPRLYIVSDRSKKSEASLLKNFDFIHFNDFKNADHLFHL